MSGIFGEKAGRRKYRDTGHRCEDCGWNRRTTKVYFWIGGSEYWFCSECIEPYRKIIMHPEPEWKR